MKISRFLLFLAISMVACSAHAQPIVQDCHKFTALKNAMTVPAAPQDVHKWQERDEYVVTLFKAMRSFEIMPNARTARDLLAVAPRDISQVGEWLSSQSNACPTISDKELLRIINFSNRLPNDIGRAATLDPSKVDVVLEFYVATSIVAEENYKSVLVLVCKRRPHEFRAALYRVSDDIRRQVNSGIDVDNCSVK